jgi:hypothetical protein
MLGIFCMKRMIFAIVVSCLMGLVALVWLTLSNTSKFSTHLEQQYQDTIDFYQQTSASGAAYSGDSGHRLRFNRTPTIPSFSLTLFLPYLSGLCQFSH